MKFHWYDIQLQRAFTNLVWCIWRNWVGIFAFWVTNFKSTFLGRQKELRAQISTISQEEINTEPPEKSRVESDILPWNGRDKRIWIRFFENISGFWQTAHQTRFKSVYLSYSMITFPNQLGIFSEARYSSTLGQQSKSGLPTDPTPSNGREKWI